MGHPYRIGGSPPHEPYWLIHKQSGDLVNEGLVEPSVSVTDNMVVGNFGFVPSEKTRALVTGISRMIPRPVVSGTMGQYKKEIIDSIKEEFKKRFGGVMGLEIS